MAGLLSNMWKRPGQGDALGILGAYLMAAGAPSYDPGGSMKLMAQGAQAYSGALRDSAQTESMRQYRDTQSKLIEAQTLAAEDKRNAQKKSLGLLYGLEPGVQPWTNPDTGVVSQPQGAIHKLPEQIRPFIQGLAAADPEKAYTAALEHMKPKEAKAPTVQEFYDEKGQPYKAQHDPATNTWKKIGGSKADNEPLVKVLNKDGTVTYKPRSEASGQSAPDEATVVMGPDNKPIFMRGGVQSMNALTTGMTQASQNEIEKNLLSATASRMQGLSILNTFKPEYQEIPTRFGMEWTALKDKGGGLLGSVKPEDKAKLDDFVNYRANAAQNFSLTLKELSGAAVTGPEMKRAEGWLPNPGTGLFDGDSPTELKSKVERLVDFQNKAVARLSYAKAHGMQFDKIPLEAMPKIIQSRGAELAETFKGKGLEGDGLNQAVKQRLAQEFGLVME